jgi:hypothetical protein
LGSNGTRVDESNAVLGEHHDLGDLLATFERASEYASFDVEVAPES